MTRIDQSLIGGNGSTPTVASGPLGANGNHPAEATGPPRPVAVEPIWSRRIIRWVTIAAVIVVAACAARSSYEHQRAVVEMAGNHDAAWYLPLSVDGMMLIASLNMLVRRWDGQPAGWLTWTALMLGGAASLTANIAAAPPTWIGRLVAAWSPVCLIVSYELLMQQLPHRTPAPGLPVAPPVSGAAPSDREVESSDLPALPAPTEDVPTPDRAVPNDLTGDAGNEQAVPATPAAPVPVAGPADDGAGPPPSTATDAGNRHGGGRRRPRRPANGKRRAGFAEFAAAAAELRAEGTAQNRTQITQQLRARGLSLSNEKADEYLARLHGGDARHNATPQAPVGANGGSAP